MLESLLDGWRRARSFCAKRGDRRTHCAHFDPAGRFVRRAPSGAFEKCKLWA